MEARYPRERDAPARGELDRAEGRCGRPRACRRRLESGDIEGKLRSYLAKPARLRSVRFDCSDLDSYGWIPEGTRYIAEAMKRAGIDVSIGTDWTSGHRVDSNLMEKSFIPFFKGAFEGVVER